MCRRGDAHRGLWVGSHPSPRENPVKKRIPAMQGLHDRGQGPKTRRQAARGEPGAFDVNQGE